MSAKRSTSVSVRLDLAPHPLDAEILGKLRELRRLVFVRGAAHISAANKGKPKAPAHREKLRAIATGRTGYRHTDETKAKISATHKGKRLTPAHRAHISEGKRA